MKDGSALGIFVRSFTVFHGIRLSQQDKRTSEYYEPIKRFILYSEHSEMDINPNKHFFEPSSSEDLLQQRGHLRYSMTRKTSQKQKEREREREKKKITGTEQKNEEKNMKQYSPYPKSRRQITWFLESRAVAHGRTCVDCTNGPVVAGELET